MNGSEMHPTLTPVRFGERTLPAILRGSARRFPADTFLRFLDPASPEASPRSITFSEFEKGVHRAAAFLRNVGVRPGDRVLLVAENSPEWQFVALAAQLLRAEPASAFANLAAEPVRDIARRVRPKVAFVSGPEQWLKLAPAADELGGLGLTALISRQMLSNGAGPSGIRLASATEACGDGAVALDPAEADALVDAVGPNDPFLLLFTSGTTGRPKGVRLPQRAIVHAIDGGNASVGTGRGDVGVHFLPFAHVAGHDQFALALAQGHSLLMASRREDIERALSLGPTYVFSVPLVYERIRGGVEAKCAALPGPLRSLARAALEAAQRTRVDGSRRLGDRLLTGVADRLVGRAVRARLGGRMRGLFVGGAACAPALFRFFEGLGIPLVELYGMTETAGLVSSNLLLGRRRPGSAGYVTADHEVRFAEDGELLLRGPLLFSGYLDPEDTDGAWTPDGFYRTGDIGRIDEEGCLRIEGRKKALLVLSTGKKLSPEPVEQAIAATPPFLGAVLLGEGRPFVSAAVFVEPRVLAELSAAGRDPSDALLASARNALGAFSDFEKPKRILVIEGAPYDHPDLVTPTLKVKRDALLSFLGSRLLALYDAGPEGPGSVAGPGGRP